MDRVLITGGTGSFGNAIVPSLLAQGCIVTVYSRDEQKQEQMCERLADHPKADSLRFFLGDVRDLRRLTQALKGVDTVIHAAALKIVPKGEFDPSEFVKTNVLGTDNLVHAALDAGVQRAVLLSTDKAVSPINLYGATKLTAERLFVGANAYHYEGGPIFSVVRYGNVACSRGSVINAFRAGTRRGKVQLTHPEATRFWITLEQAVWFVLEALRVMCGGEIFIPRMPSFKVAALLEAVIESMPKKFERPKVETTGLRPGEKVHEDLITVHEAPNVYETDGSFTIVPPGMRPEKQTLAAGLTSASNAWWLPRDELVRLLGEVG